MKDISDVSSCDGGLSGGEGDGEMTGEQSRDDETKSMAFGAEEPAACFVTVGNCWAKSFKTDWSGMGKVI